ncbi:hypothetical protein EV714DRAFT_278273 [Schizophyllum commune]
MERPGMVRISGFDNGATQAWARKLHTFLRDNQRILRGRLPHLRHNFRPSVWAATTVNYGLRTAMLPRKDFANLPWGCCPITALRKTTPRAEGTSGGDSHSDLMEAEDESDADDEPELSSQGLEFVGCHVPVLHL